MTEINEHRVNELKTVSNKLDALIKAKGNGISKANFWAGLLVSIMILLGTVGSVFSSYSKLKTNFENHINNKEIHMTPEKNQIIILNEQHAKNCSYNILTKTFVSFPEFKNLKERVEKVENKIEDLNE